MEVGGQFHDSVTLSDGKEALFYGSGALMVLRSGLDVAVHRIEHSDGYLSAT